MRRVLICIMVLMAFAGSSSAQKTLDNSEVNSQWRTKRISVKDGGQTPDVVTLLRAFHQALPTWAVNQVLKQADHPAKGTRQSGTAAISPSPLLAESYSFSDDAKDAYSLTAGTAMQIWHLKQISTRRQPASGARTMATASSPYPFSNNMGIHRMCSAGTTMTLRRRQ